MLRIVLTLLICLPLFPRTLRAEFILDDFDDPAQVVSPEMEGVPVDTENVGALGAKRGISIFDVFTNPQARADVNISNPSQLTASVQPQDPLGPLG